MKVSVEGNIPLPAMPDTSHKLNSPDVVAQGEDIVARFNRGELSYPAARAAIQALRSDDERGFHSGLPTSPQLSSGKVAELFARFDSARVAAHKSAEASRTRIDGEVAAITARVRLGAMPRAEGTARLTTLVQEGSISEAQLEQVKRLWENEKSNIAANVVSRVLDEQLFAHVARREMPVEDVMVRLRSIDGLTSKDLQAIEVELQLVVARGIVPDAEKFMLSPAEARVRLQSFAALLPKQELAELEKRLQSVENTVAGAERWQALNPSRSVPPSFGGKTGGMPLHPSQLVVTTDGKKG